MRIVYSQHALNRLKERKISPKKVDFTIDQPDKLKKVLEIAESIKNL